MADRQRFINCIKNNIRRYTLAYLYAVLEGRRKDPVISEAWRRWTKTKGFGCKQAVEFIRKKKGDERKRGRTRGSRNPALRRLLRERRRRAGS